MFGSYGVVWSTYTTTSRQTCLSIVGEQMIVPSADKFSHGASKTGVLLKVQDFNIRGRKPRDHFSTTPGMLCALIVRDNKCFFQEKMHNFADYVKKLLQNLLDF
jgi:hypothetical protein